MQQVPLFFSVRYAEGPQETLSISIAGNRSGEATVRYGDATATIHAHVAMEQTTVGLSEVAEFHQSFATELLAYVLNRGAMAQDSNGEIVYDFGGQSLALPLPDNAELGLGYPNSW
jgi:hypothetical protein